MFFLLQIYDSEKAAWIYRWQLMESIKPTMTNREKEEGDKHKRYLYLLNIPIYDRLLQTVLPQT